MEYRNLGQSGLKVSAVGLGCNNFGMILDASATKPVVHKALDLGITLFDTADQYGAGQSEEYLGKALGAKRKDIVLATKFGNPMGDSLAEEGGASRHYIMHAVEASLRRLKTDYIDLYQIHRPDPETSLEETARAMDDLVQQGKVRYIGHSNFAAWQAVDAAWITLVNGLTPFISAQNRYSLLSRAAEAELIPACEAHGLGLLPYFPLESGLLTGKYQRGKKPRKGTRWAAWANRPAMANRFFGEDRLAQVDDIEKLCSKYGHSLLEMAVGWLLDKPCVSSVIAGATKPQQLIVNVKAAAWRPTSEEAKEMDAVSPPPPAGLPAPRTR